MLNRTTNFGFLKLSQIRNDEDNKPDCFWTTGVVTKDWTTLPDSEHMLDTDLCHECNGTAKTVYIDGSSYKIGNSNYSGWGLWSPDDVNFRDSGPLKGKNQSSDRAEVRALVAALEKNQVEIDIITDNQYVRNTAQYLQAGGAVHKGKHCDLWTRIKQQIHKMKSIRWVKAHLKKENATKAGVSYEDWYGNNEADIQAKEGAAKHGYTENQKNIIRGKVTLARNVQEHMVKTYIKYIQHTAVREDALNNKKVKGSPTGKKGRQIITPAQMGHKVQTSTDYEYCLDCGRETKTCRSTNDKIIFWRRNYCKPIARIIRYKKRRHDICFDTWWICGNCKAKGPEFNKRDCTNPCTNTDENEEDHRHKRRRTQDYGHAEDNEEERKYGTIANRGSRHRAQEAQDLINKRINDNIHAHQESTIFEIPVITDRTIDISDEQTNHSFFEGKETRKRAMLKAKQIQLGKQEKAVEFNKKRKDMITKERDNEEADTTVKTRIKRYEDMIREDNTHKILNATSSADHIEKKEITNFSEIRCNTRYQPTIGPHAIPFRLHGIGAKISFFGIAFGAIINVRLFGLQRFWRRIGVDNGNGDFLIVQANNSFEGFN